MSKKKHPHTGKWVITYVMRPYPSGVGKIVDVWFNSEGEVYGYDIKFPYGIDPWHIKYCKIFNKEKDAKKEYDDFTKNKNNYAYEG